MRPSFSLRQGAARILRAWQSTLRHLFLLGLFIQALAYPVGSLHAFLALQQSIAAALMIALKLHSENDRGCPQQKIVTSE